MLLCVSTWNVAKCTATPISVYLDLDVNNTILCKAGQNGMKKSHGTWELLPRWMKTLNHSKHAINLRFPVKLVVKISLLCDVGSTSKLFLWISLHDSMKKSREFWETRWCYYLQRRFLVLFVKMSFELVA